MESFVLKTVVSVLQQEKIFERSREKIAATGIIAALLKLSEFDAKTGKPVA